MGCVRLRRRPPAIVMGLFGFAPTLFAVVFAVLSVRDAEWLYFVVPCLAVAVFPLFRPLRLCGGDLVVPRFVVKEFRQPLDAVSVLEVGRFGWSGLNGYRGLALVLHTPGKRRLVYHSLYCGERRLRDWVAIIEASDAFSGEVRWSSEFERWESAHNFPVV